MVSTAIKPGFQTGVRPSVEYVGGRSADVARKPVPVSNRTPSCLRCGTRMVMSYEEPECLACGYVEYSYTREFTGNRNNLLSTATRYVLRYVGDSPALSETLTQVKLIRIRNRVGFAVNCPFCEQIMDESSLSGKRPEAREQRYKCNDGHRVSLIPCSNGMLGWR